MAAGDVEMNFQQVDQQDDLNSKMDLVDVNATMKESPAEEDNVNLKVNGDDSLSHESLEGVEVEGKESKTETEDVKVKENGIDSPPEEGEASVDEESQIVPPTTPTTPATSAMQQSSSSELVEFFNTPMQSNSQLSQSSSSTAGAGSQCKKSNLRKFSKYESLAGVADLFFTPPTKRSHDDGSPTPRKRIRIVVSKLEQTFCDESKFDESATEDEDELDLLQDLDCSVEDMPSGLGEDDDDEEQEEETENVAESNLHWAEIRGEKLIWVSRQKLPLDFTLINEDVVRAMRTPLGKKFSVEIDMHFIDSETFSQLLHCKARTFECGPWNYERECLKELTNRNDSTAGDAIPKFVYKENATKLQNLDELLDFELTLPSNFFQDCDITKQDNVSDSEEREFYFADIWFKSKGHREYILSKSLEYIEKGVMIKGFAIQDCIGKEDKSFNSAGILFSSTSLPKIDFHDNDNDLNLNSRSLPIELVDHFHSDSTSTENNQIDICDILVSDDYVKEILAKTDGKGVHLLVADNEERMHIYEGVREVRLQRKFFAQSIIALLSIREGGNFVVKIFDAITSFTVGLIFLLNRCFSSLTIHKPKSSPAHSSERFLICRGKIQSAEVDDIIQFLLQIHGIVMHNEEIRRVFRKKIRRRLDVSKFEVRQIIPLKVIIAHADFFEFLRLTNIRMTKEMCTGINAVCQAVEDFAKQQKISNDQKSINGGSSKEVNVEMKDVSKGEQDTLAQMLILAGLEISPNDGLIFKETMSKAKYAEILKKREDWAIFETQDWKRVFLAQELTLFIGLGGNDVRYWDKNDFKWIAVIVEGISLTKGSLVLGHVCEFFPIQCDEATPYKFSVEFQICDAMSLSGKFIGDMPFSQRRKILACYISAMNKSMDVKKRQRLLNFAPVVELKEKESNFCHWLLSMRNVSNEPFYKERMNVRADDESQVSIGGLCFWNISGSFRNSMMDSVLWNWNESDSTAVLLRDFTSVLL